MAPLWIVLFVTSLSASTHPRTLDLVIDRDDIVSGESYLATFSGEGLAPEACFDIRYRAPRSDRELIMRHWQYGLTAQHPTDASTLRGMWEITGVRAHIHASGDDSLDENFVPIAPARVRVRPQLWEVFVFLAMMSFEVIVAGVGIRKLLLHLNNRAR